MHTRAERKRPIPRGAWLCLWLTAAAALGLSGCTTGLPEYVHNGFKVGPNYQPPPVPVPPRWIDDNTPLVRRGNPNLATWWDVFDDPGLNKLLQESYTGNLTLRAAGLQIMAFKDQRLIAASELLPQSQSYNFQYTHGEVSANGGNAAAAANAFGSSLSPTVGIVGGAVSAPVAGVAAATGMTTTPPTATPPIGSSIGGSGAFGGGGGGRFFNNVANSLNLSWELDVWGLFRRNLEAADASLDQSVQNYDEMLVLLLANVATQYVEIRTLQRRLELARQNVALQQPLVDQFEKRFQAQMANSYLGYHQLKANLDNTKALIPQLEISLRQANNQLCVLLGIPVRDLLPELGESKGPDPDDAKKQIVRIPRPRDESVVLDIPGEILLRRPDVQAAESQLRVQSAQIGVAEAEMFPHIGVNGSIGLAADNLGRLFNSQSWTGSIGPSLSWNILNYGRLLANVRIQNTQFQQAVALYQNTILTANQDAENALVAYLQTLEQAKNLQDSAVAAAKSYQYLLKQFNEGAGGADTGAFINQLFTVINFQVAQQDSAAQAEGNIALNLILLYRALGGGWQIRLKPEPQQWPHSGPNDFHMPEAAPPPRVTVSVEAPPPMRADLGTPVGR